MPAFFEIRDWRDIYAKAQHDYAGLEKSVNAYDTFNFLCTVNHLGDWFTKDDTTKQSIRDECKKGVYQQAAIRTIFQLCNQAKHYKPRENTPPTVSKRGYGMGRYNVGSYGSGEPSYRVMIGEESVSILDLGKQALSIWNEFFLKHGLLEHADAKTCNLTASG